MKPKRAQIQDHTGNVIKNDNDGVFLFIYVALYVKSKMLMMTFFPRSLKNDIDDT